MDTKLELEDLCLLYCHYVTYIMHNCIRGKIRQIVVIKLAYFDNILYYLLHCSTTSVSRTKHYVLAAFFTCGLTEFWGCNILLTDHLMNYCFVISTYLDTPFLLGVV